MEQHPVPQNVTTFQFRLIGDMTIKQFGYLAGGAILAYISYKLPLPFFITWPLAIIAAVGGFGFAFVPIEERPMDVWVMSFFKSVYSPTQYVWSKTSEQPVQTPAPAAAAPVTKRASVLQGIFSSQGAVLTQNQVRERRPFDWFFAMLSPRAPVSRAPAPALSQTPLPATMKVRPPDMTPPPEVKTREAMVEQKIASVAKEIKETNSTQPHVSELQKQLSDLISQRDSLINELARLKKQTAPPEPPKPTGTYVATPASQKGPSVRIITPDRAVYAGLPRLTNVPNIVTGIVKDGDQNLLPGVLVTVKDKEGVPVRALKTNRLGQFAASTPIPNGVYFVEVEDPRMRFTFDRAQITVNGSVIPALEIFAKSQKEITRAKLEKELFGSKVQ